VVVPASEAEPAPAWHALDPEGVVAAFDTDLEGGLTSEEAGVRLESVGPNVVSSAPRWVRTRRLLNQFNDVLIWLLIVAAVVSGLLLDAWVDAAAIGAIVVLNAVLGYVQEARADSALRELEEMSAPWATVIRSELVTEVLARDLVPGDLVVVESGDQIPADGRVVAAARLQVSESSLTGESLPVEKMVAAVGAEHGVVARPSMVFAGTAVTAGRGRSIVTATGVNTELGKIAALVATKSPPTPLQVELARVGRRLAVVAVVAAILIFGAGLARSYPVETMFLTAVALAVAAIPEGLPAVNTVTLSGGVQRMARKNAIVRRLPAVEALGAVNVICTDKTGTLTRNNLSVHEVLVAGGVRVPSELGDSQSPAALLGGVAALCNDAEPTEEGFSGDATDVALLRWLEGAQVNFAELRHAAPRIDEVGFDSRRKRMTTLHERDGRFWLACKGAPEVVVAGADRIVGADGRAVSMNTDRRLEVLEQAEALAAGGLRTLAFAGCWMDTMPADLADHESGLDFIGIVGLSDEVRPEVRDAVRQARQAGVDTVMVTGDHVVTADAVATEVGLRKGLVMPGRELRAIPEADLDVQIREYKAFARVDPLDKVKIVRSHQRDGSLVAMTGDGVNDAPALRVADIGIAMGSGTDVAREASALVLADDNYATIVAAIEEGRRIFGNLRNVVHYLLSANTAEVLFMVAGFLAFGFLGEPLLAVQLLWINLLSDALPALALGMDEPTHDVMQDQPGEGRDILSRQNLLLLLGQGIILAVATGATLYAGYVVLDLEYEAARTMAFSTLVLAQLVHAINVRSANAKLSWPRPFLTWSILFSALLQVAVIYLPMGQRVFDIMPLGPAEWLWVLGISTAAFAGSRALYVIFWKRKERVTLA